MKFYWQKITVGKVILILQILMVIFFSLLSLAVIKGSHWAWINIVGSDGASDVISAISYHYNLGIPYKDYWEYRPPGWTMLVDIWVRVFGFRIFSFKLMELVFRLGVGLEIVFLSRKIFPHFQSLIVSFLTCFVFFSPPFGTMMLAEPYGLFFSLLGLLILILVNNFNRRFFFAAFFIFLSGQIKDPYLFSSLTFAPILLYFLVTKKFRLFLKALLLIFGGFFICILPLWLYLTNLGSLEAYLQTLTFKSTNFDAKFWENIGFFLSRSYNAFETVKLTLFRFGFLTPVSISIWFLILIISISPRKFLLGVKKKREALILNFPTLNFYITKSRMVDLIVVFYSTGTFMGFSLNNSFTPRTMAIVVVATFLFWSIIISSIASSVQLIWKKLNKNIIFLFLAFFTLAPKGWIFMPYMDIPFDNLFSQVYTNLSIPDDPTPIEKLIQAQTTPDDCVISLYGWKSPEVPLYSHRRPCSRFVQANMVNDLWQKVEYRNSILNNPPKVIVYSLEGADMNVEKFENEVVNFTRIINNCYKQDKNITHNGRWSLELYFSKYSGEELKSCVKKNNIIKI